MRLPWRLMWAGCAIAALLNGCDCGGGTSPEDGASAKDAARDASSGDSAQGDTASSDSTRNDTATPDRATRPDTASHDTATTDTAVTDAATTDSATADSATTDSATTDSATADSATSDSATTDAEIADAVSTDAEIADAESTDAEQSDTVPLDVEATDALADSAAEDAETHDSAAPGDTTAPTVLETAPADRARGVEIVAPISVTFSEPMDPASLEGAIELWLDNGDQVEGSVTVEGNTATFTPASVLTCLASYTATVSAEARDLAGNPLAAPHAWRFGTGNIPNGGFEQDPTGTTQANLSGWDTSTVVSGDPGGATEDSVEVVDDYAFTGARSLLTQVGSGGSLHNNVYQSLLPETLVPTTAGHITLWVAGASYTTPSRYYWRIELVMSDGVATHTEILRCDCWGLNEGCSPTDHYDNYAEEAVGADGHPWRRYTTAIPADLDRSHLSIQVLHRQHSWDSTTATSAYRLDDVYFSDAAGARCNAAIPNGGFEADAAGTGFDDISGWSHTTGITGASTGEELGVVDDHAYGGAQSVYSYVGSGGTSYNAVSQSFFPELSLCTAADHVTLWLGDAGYTSSSRYTWNVTLVLSDGTHSSSDILRCDCWGNNEACTPTNHYDNYDEKAVGTDGLTWMRYTREIPAEMDRSRLSLKILHQQHSWDGTSASSWYWLDDVSCSDADGQPW